MEMYIIDNEANDVKDNWRFDWIIDDNWILLDIILNIIIDCIISDILNYWKFNNLIWLNFFKIFNEKIKIIITETIILRKKKKIIWIVFNLNRYIC